MKIRALTILACGLVRASVLVAQPAPSRQADLRPTSVCERVELSGNAKPAYTVSGSWVSPDQLALVDAARNNLLRIDLKGNFLGWQSPNVDEQVQQKLSARFFPVAIELAKDGIWLELTQTRMAKLSGVRSYLTGVDLWGLNMDEGAANLIGLFDWTLAEDDLFGFGSFRMMEDGERGDKAVGFFRANLTSIMDEKVTDYHMLDVEYDALDNGEMVTKTVRYIPATDPMQLWYRLGNPYVASIGSTGYALLIYDRDGDGVADRWGLGESAPAGDSVKLIGKFTDALRVAPELPPFKNTDDFVGVMDKFSMTTAPAGLFSLNDRLVLLWRSVEHGESAWVLSSINPRARSADGSVRPRVEGSVVISSQATHIMVVPGPKKWAFVEKGPVIDFGAQSVDSVLYVASSELSRAFSSGGVLCQ